MEGGKAVYSCRAGRLYFFSSRNRNIQPDDCLYDDDGGDGDDDEDINDDDNDLQVVDKQQVGRENMWQGWPLGAGASKV